ncbi:hypothetical protein P879_03127 [Paragonimus westermani]|uniref:Cyanocobalamin reductase (cyanide-eliminating) n=1 Tax=Paragonimus westermani TaxID=34504 RepID=A0A8T0DQW5_9TREM|nr:hypothetical protein P879_03127 [Paragonimus westermani]
MQDVDTSLKLVSRTLTSLTGSLSPYGFEFAPFLVGWYNALVSGRLKLDNATAPHADCVVICIISNPKMFEQSFLPHLTSWFQADGVHSLGGALGGLKKQTNGYLQSPGLNDPLDWSVLLRINEGLNASLKTLQEQLSPDEFAMLASPRFITDYAMRPVTRLPYVHVQCAGHVSGLAYFHQRDTVNCAPQFGNGNPGCSLHPRYGGWFGFRGIVVFPNLRCPNLPRPVPVSSLPPGFPPFASELLDKLLIEFRDHWRENRWRNFGLPEDSHQLYTAKAQLFFNTPPAKRAALLESWMCCSNLNSCPSVLVQSGVRTF